LVVVVEVLVDELDVFVVLVLVELADVVLVDVFVVEVLVVEVFDVLVEDETVTTVPEDEQGKSKLEVDAMFSQINSSLPLFPTKLVPVAVMSLQIAEQTKETTVSLVPVPAMLI